MPANAGDTGSIPDPGGSHMLQATIVLPWPWAHAPQQEKPLPREARALQLEKKPTQQWKLSTANI